MLMAATHPLSSAFTVPIWGQKPFILFGGRGAPEGGNEAWIHVV